MTRLILASIAVVGALAVFSYAVKAQETPKKGALPKSNQVYVKIVWPADPATKDKGPVVESWIAEQLKKRGQTKFTAATPWVPLTDKEEYRGKRFTRVLDGCPDGGCPVAGQIAERADGRIKIRLDGWSPAYCEVTVALTDEPGSREIAAVEQRKTEQGLPYVAVLIGPPPENTAAPNDHKE